MKDLKDKIKAARTRGVKSSLISTYTQHDKHARSDKRRFYNQLATDAQKALSEHRYKDLYTIIKRLTGKSFSNTRTLKNSEGYVTTSTKDQMEIWQQHYLSMHLSN